MKLATYEHEGRRSWGVLRQDRIADIPSAWPDGPASLRQALAEGALQRAAELADAEAPALALDDVRLLAPIPDPPKLFGLAVNYAEHHAECNRGSDLPDEPRRTTTPRPFLMPATAVSGPDTVVPWCTYSRQIDYEVELAVVIGARCTCVEPDDAAGFIAGYTIANDISARSVTHAEGRAERPKDAFFDWLHGKWADGFCPLGPWLVTAEEIGDPQALDIEMRVNGEVRQSANTREMIFSVYELVAFISRLVTLEPGDVIATGTPSGVGVATGNFLAPGDTMTCRIERIGELTNTLGQPPESFYTPCAR